MEIDQLFTADDRAKVDAIGREFGYVIARSPSRLDMMLARCAEPEPIVPPAPITLTFCEIEAALAKVHGIASPKRTAFSSRLKNLFRLGLIKTGSLGKGVTVRYSLEDYLRLVIALEITQLGIGPADAVEMINDIWAEVRPGLRGKGAGGGANYAIIEMHALRDLQHTKKALATVKIVQGVSNVRFTTSALFLNLSAVAELSAVSLALYVDATAEQLRAALGF